MVVAGSECMKESDGATHSRSGQSQNIRPRRPVNNSKSDTSIRFELELRHEIRPGE